MEEKKSEKKSNIYTNTKAYSRGFPGGAQAHTTTYKNWKTSMFGIYSNINSCRTCCRGFTRLELLLKGIDGAHKSGGYMSLIMN